MAYSDVKDVEKLSDGDGSMICLWRSGASAARIGRVVVAL
jgi:hypothetical protein